MLGRGISTTCKNVLAGFKVRGGKWVLSLDAAPRSIALLPLQCQRLKVRLSVRFAPIFFPAVLHGFDASLSALKKYNTRRGL